MNKSYFPEGVMKRFVCLALALLLLPLPLAAFAETPAVSIAAPSAILMEKETCKV